MKKIAIFIAVAVVLVLGAAPALAQEIPSFPHAFYGSVTVNGAPAPNGTQVSATVDSGSVITNAQNPTTTVGGSYGVNSLPLLVQGDILNGATITFYVNGVSTGQIYLFEAGGGPSLRNLSVTIAAPPGGGGGGFGPGDITEPRISNVGFCLEASVTETTADICWETQELSDSQVEYWASPSMFSELDEEMVIDHQVQLTGLTPGTLYHYKVMSRDRADNLGVSDEYTFTTLGKAPVAAFTTRDLSITPSEVAIGETVTISMLVTNTGSAAGGYKVTLKIDGVVEATEEVTLKAGASEEVTFTTAKDIAGTYSVDINGLSGSFTVKEKPAPAPPTPPPAPPAPTPEEPVNWLLIGGIIAGVAVAVVTFFWVRRRAE